MRGGDLVGLLVVLSLVSACGGSFPAEEVPGDPIAFVRQEAAKGISGLDEFREALRIPNPEDPRTLKARRTTTLSLLYVPTGEIREVPGMRAGALPLDWSPDGFLLLVGQWDRGIGRYRLSSWNRVTGAHDRVRTELTSGGASIGPGPIRLAQVGRVQALGLNSPVGVRLWVTREGLVDLPGGAPGREPDISPDGRTVLFERPSAGLRRDGTILLARLGEERHKALGRGSLPRYSRDGKWITFLRRRDGQTDVWLMRADGSGKRALTNTSFDEEYPAVSPAGRFVAFASVRPPKQESQIFLVRVADGSEIQLTQSGQNGRPRW